MGSENGHGPMRERVEVALIGAGIGSSLSPALHEHEGRMLGFDYAYGLRDLGEDAFDEDIVCREVERARADGLRGLNVTHPSKQLVQRALDALAPEAAALGAVNTVVFSDRGAVGHNTDTTGFCAAFAAGLPRAPTERVVLVGAGGAGTAVAFALLGMEVGHLAIVDAEAERAERLAAELGERFGSERAAADTLEGVLPGADGLVHATPTGMGGTAESAVDPALLRAGLWVAEVVYVPLETQLLRDARAAGCRTLDGGGMVVAQAADSLELFTGVAPDRSRMAAHMAQLVADERGALR